MKLSIPMILQTAAVAILLSLVTVMLCKFSVDRTLESTIPTTATSAALAVSGVVDEMKIIATYAGLDPVVCDIEATDEERLAALEAYCSNYDFMGSYLVDADGKSAVDGSDLSDADFYKSSIAGEVYTSSPMIDPASDELVFINSAPIWKDGIRGSEIVGVAAVAVPHSFVNRIIENLNPSENSYSYVIDKDGYTIADPDIQLVRDKENVEANALTDEGAAAVAVYHAKARAGETGFGEYKYYGVPEYVGYAPIEGWALKAGLPASASIRTTSWEPLKQLSLWRFSQQYWLPY